jgi:beta-lactamase regulating signal transducer with metallopeptidase domain
MRAATDESRNVSGILEMSVESRAIPPNEVTRLTTVNAAAEAILVAFGLFLVGLTVLVFARAVVAERFFMSFASSARAHYTEQIVRFLVGASLIIRSAAMWQPKAFWFVGWAIVLSSLVLILTPWQWHQRLGEKVLPIVIRRIKLFAIGLLAFGVLLIYAVCRIGA